MAIFSLRVQTIGRAAGRSVVAAAAYRSGSQLADQRLGMGFDFTDKRGGIAHTEIIAPENAPAELLDRGTLWNAADRSEKRADAVPAREILVALPSELNDEQRRELVQAFANASLVARGMIADVAIHYPGAEGDARNHHAHILVTTRNVGADGFGGKNRDWHSPQFVSDVRREWAEVQNRYLERYAPGTPKVSEKSLADQGVDREPTQHLGPDASAMERRGQRTDVGENNRDIEAQNQGFAREDRRLDQAVADGFKAQTWTRRPTDEVIKSLEASRTALADQREAWRREREGIEVPKPTSVRRLEAKLTREKAAALRRAQRAEKQNTERARQRGVSMKRIAEWHTNPARAALRALFGWNRSLDAAAEARRNTERARRELEQQRAWTKTPEGRAHIQALREPTLDAAKSARSARRTLERKIRRMDKRIETADQAILKTKVAKRLGVEKLRVPKAVPTTPGRGDANVKRYFRAMTAEAQVAYARAPEADIQAALKFIRGLLPGAPVPSGRPAQVVRTGSPNPLNPTSTGGAPNAPDLPDL